MLKINSLFVFDFLGSDGVTDELSVIDVFSVWEYKTEFKNKNNKTIFIPLSIIANIIKKTQSNFRLIELFSTFFEFI